METFNNINLLRKLVYAQAYLGGDISGLVKISSTFTPEFHELFNKVKIEVQHDMHIITVHRSFRTARNIKTFVQSYEKLVEQAQTNSSDEMAKLLEIIELLINETLTKLKKENPSYEKELQDKKFTSFHDNMIIMDIFNLADGLTMIDPKQLKDHIQRTKLSMFGQEE
jgi:hypothetical protein